VSDFIANLFLEIMDIKEAIIHDVQTLQSPLLLGQVFEYVQHIKKADHRLQSNCDAVLKYAGTLGNADAAAMLALINKEFSTIEGEW
jgi:hypothetical protein